MIESLLWTFVIVFFGAGDLFTTSLGLLSGGVTETGPVVALVVERFGVFAMVPLKLVTIGLAYVAWRVVSGTRGLAVLLGFAVVGIVVTAWNLRVLVSVFVG